MGDAVCRPQSAPRGRRGRWTESRRLRRCPTGACAALTLLPSIPVVGPQQPRFTAGYARANRVRMWRFRGEACWFVDSTGCVRCFVRCFHRPRSRRVGELCACEGLMLRERCCARVRRHARRVCRHRGDMTPITIAVSVGEVRYVWLVCLSSRERYAVLDGCCMLVSASKLVGALGGCVPVGFVVRVARRRRHYCTAFSFTHGRWTAAKRNRKRERRALRRLRHHNPMGPITSISARKFP